MKLTQYSSHSLSKHDVGALPCSRRRSYRVTHWRGCQLPFVPKAFTSNGAPFIPTERHLMKCHVGLDLVRFLINPDMWATQGRNPAQRSVYPPKHSSDWRDRVLSANPVTHAPAKPTILTRAGDLPFAVSKRLDNDHSHEATGLKLERGMAARDLARIIHQPHRVSGRFSRIAQKPLANARRLICAVFWAK